MAIKPSDSELTMLRCLWRHQQLSAREIHDHTSSQTVWAYSTTRKTLDRMVEKGILKVEPVHGMKTFLPAQSKIETMATLISHFAKTVLDTDGPLPATTFVQSRLVDDGELEELQAMLEEMDKQAGSSS